MRCQRPHVIDQRLRAVGAQHQTVQRAHRRQHFLGDRAGDGKCHRATCGRGPVTGSAEIGQNDAAAAGERTPFGVAILAAVE